MILDLQKPLKSLFSSLQMVKMEVEVISKENIRPSSQTPILLKIHKLSLLDQYMPPVYIPLIVFYSKNQDTDLPDKDFISKRSLLLKQSLSETLTRFYPLAGRIRDNSSIDCNDEGVHYIQARVNCPLSEYLKAPGSLNLVPPVEVNLRAETGPGFHLLLIQENIFACGGLAIGVIVSHMIADGTAMSSFIKGWAETACKSGERTVFPNFDAASIFPQNIPFPKEATAMAMCGPFFRTGRQGSRRFMFDASAVACLKTKATSLSVKDPTRVEAVSALLCKCIIAVLRSRSGLSKPTVISHAVNMRRRAVPPLPVWSMGNFIWQGEAHCTAEEMESVTICSLVHRIREAISKTDGDLVKSLQGDGGMLKLWEVVKDRTATFGSPSFSSGMDHVVFTSWCNFGLYDVDFGWGKPIWVSLSQQDQGEFYETPFLNMALLMDTRLGKGVEAYVFLDKEELLILERDEELLKYAAVDPSPLKPDMP